MKTIPSKVVAESYFIDLWVSFTLIQSNADTP